MDLKVEKLSKCFGRKTAVDKIDLHMHEGIYGFLGANGAGKTTLMRILCGVLKPTEGSVKVNGRDHLAMGEEFRGMLGYLPQDFGYFPGFTAGEFMEYIGALKGLMPDYSRKRSRELLDVVGLADVARQRIKTFSGGMRQRLGIAQALLGDPDILILDEPTAGLDPKERVRFRNLIADYAKGRLVILSTHIVGDVECIADEILVMKNGSFILQGTVQELTQTMEGKVWDCTVLEEEAEELVEKGCLANIHHQDGKARIRLITDKKPTEDALMAAPVLEDLYLSCFPDSGERRNEKWAG